MRSPAPNSNVATQVAVAPKGAEKDNFIIVGLEELANATKSKKLARFANITSAPVELSLTKVNIPPYAARKSQRELKSLAAKDPELSAKITKRQKKATKLHIQKTGQPLPTASSKGSPVSLSSETESSDDDDSDSSYDSDSSPPPEKSPLPATRPLKAVDAVRYDTIKAVWFPRNKFAENARILKGLADLWEVIRTIRDRWKSDRDAVKKALELKQESELPLLRERVDKQLEMMETVLSAAVEFGHPDLLSAYVFFLRPFPYLQAARKCCIARQAYNYLLYALPQCFERIRDVIPQLGNSSCLIKNMHICKAYATACNWLARSKRESSRNTQSKSFAIIPISTVIKIGH